MLSSGTRRNIAKSNNNSLLRFELRKKKKRESHFSLLGVYTVTQQDINNGVPIVNTASVTFANAGTVLTSATVGVNSVTAFTVTKTASPSVVTSGLGASVLYSVVVANTGSSDLTGFQVNKMRFFFFLSYFFFLSFFSKINDPLFPGGMSCSPVSPGQTLSRGSSTTCSASYTVNAGDVARGTIVNVVTVTLGGLQRTASAVVSIQQQQQGSLTLTKTANTTFVSSAGQAVSYTLTARNVGGANLLGVTISDPLLPTLVCQPLNNGQALAPGTFLTCQGVLVVSQAQINSGIIVNTARAVANGGAITAQATATVVVSSTPPPTSSSDVTTTPSPTPTIFFSKTSSPEIVSAAGQTITYTIRATNGGLATLNNVVISDPVLALSCNPAPGSSLVSGGIMTCVGSTVVTASQIQSGADIVNTATVSANGVPTITQAKATVKVAAVGTLAISKTTTATEYSVVGSRIPYRITILNNLNTNAQNLIVTDPAIDSTTNDLVCSPVPRSGGTLAVGATTVCTGSLLVTQAILTGGQPIVNTAFVSAQGTQSFSSSVSTPKGSSGQLVFQIVIINGQVVFQTVKRAEEEMNLHDMGMRNTDLSSIRLRVIDSSGAVFFFNLTADGRFTGTFAPGQAQILILVETLPPGITLAPGSTNPVFVTIPANGVIGAQIVFAAGTTLSGKVYNDLNGNGIQDNGEPGISGASVQITAASLPTTTVTTNATGFWVAAVNANEPTSSFVLVNTLGLGSSVTATNPPNPTNPVSVPLGTQVVLTPTGFRAAATTPPTTTPQPPNPPPATQVGDTEINFYFRNILRGACGCSAGNTNCPCGSA